MIRSPASLIAMPITDNHHSSVHQAFLQKDCYSYPVDNVDYVSTHISHIYLTGDYVYKIKKSVSFNFLDFSTLALRKHFCEEEIRLNQRLAPELYLRVVPISWWNNQVMIDCTDGEVIEYAVLMRQFDRSQELDSLLNQGELSDRHIEELAVTVARFHEQAAQVDKNSAFGNEQNVIQPMRNNFIELYSQPHSDAVEITLESLEKWTKASWEHNKQFALERKNAGYIRECHGDLHLGNIAVIDEKVTPFDGIEFNPELYNIDVMSDLAFPVMNLEDYDQPQLANQLLNEYLSQTGDYQGLRLLNLYKVYRALVRAKVNALQASQQQEWEQREQLSHRAEHYIQLADRYTKERPAVMFLTHGLSGSGKTWQSRRIAPQINAIHIRSDVERKRLYAATESDLYSDGLTAQTYQHLQALSTTIIQSGYSVIVDATFLDSEQRDWFYELAKQIETRCMVLHFETPVEQLRDNTRRREQQGSDASDADLTVLDLQLQHYQPLRSDEARCVISFGQDLPIEAIRQFIDES